MEMLTLIYIFSSFIVAGIWLWSAITISPYVRKGKSAMVAFTMYWIFNPGWFTEEGKEVFQRERRRVALSLCFVLFLWLVIVIIRIIKE